MAQHTSATTPGCHDGRVLLLSQQELRARYAEAAAEANLLAGLLRLAERVSRRRSGPVRVPVQMRPKRFR